MSTLEERVTALEAELDKLKEEVKHPLARPGVIGRTRPDFLEQFTGIFAEQPAFTTMVKAIEAERERERREAETDLAAQ